MPLWRPGGQHWRAGPRPPGQWHDSEVPGGGRLRRSRWPDAVLGACPRLRDRACAQRIRLRERQSAQHGRTRRRDRRGRGADSIVDPDGVGPRIWFQIVPEAKVVKNRLHLDVPASGGRRVPIEVRRQRVTAKAGELVAAGATQLRVLAAYGIDHYAQVLHGPEGNEFCVH